MIRKEYNQKLYDNYGKPAEDLVAINISRLPWVKEVEKFPDGEMGVDLKVIGHEGRVIYVDVERRSNWRSCDEEFSLDTIHVLFRKTHFIKEKTPFTLCVVRDDAKRALFIDGKDILNCEIITWSNKYVASGEKFYDVNPKDVTVVYMDLQ